MFKGGWGVIQKTNCIFPATVTMHTFHPGNLCKLNCHFRWASRRVLKSRDPITLCIDMPTKYNPVVSFLSLLPTPSGSPVASVLSLKPSPVLCVALTFDNTENAFPNTPCLFVKKQRRFPPLFHGCYC